MVAGVGVGGAEAAGKESAWHATGARTVGEFRCGACGYGIVCRSALPVCPMCRGSSWEQSPWRPFTRARERR